MLTADEIHTFAIFSETASLSAAARRLHLTQPAVHAHVKRLSEALGVPLYHRVGRHLELTREGLEVAAFARDAVDRSADLVRRIRGEAVDRRIVLAAGPGALLHVISGGIRAFAHGDGGRIEILSADANAAIEATLRGVAHVGVAAVTAVPDGLEAHRLTEVDQVLVMPKDHPLRVRRRIALADLHGVRMVVPPPGRPQRAILDTAFAEHGVRFETAATAVGWELVLRLVELGIGLAVVNGAVQLPRTLVSRPIRELPRVRYVAFTRPRPRAEAAALCAALVRHVGTIARDPVRKRP